MGCGYKWWVFTCALISIAFTAAAMYFIIDFINDDIENSKYLGDKEALERQRIIFIAVGAVVLLFHVMGMIASVIGNYCLLITYAVWCCIEAGASIYASFGINSGGWAGVGFYVAAATLTYYAAVEARANNIIRTQPAQTQRTSMTPNTINSKVNNWTTGQGFPGQVNFQNQQFGPIPAQSYNMAHMQTYANVPVQPVSNVPGQSYNNDSYGVMYNGPANNYQGFQYTGNVENNSTYGGPERKQSYPVESQPQPGWNN